MAVDLGLQGTVFLGARLLYASILVRQGLKHVTDGGHLLAYAADRDVPAPELAVRGSGVLLLGGGLGVALGAFPTVAAGLVALFLAVSIPNTHDFWAAPAADAASDPALLVKNLELLVASVAFAVLGGETWAYALNVGY